MIRGTLAGLGLALVLAPPTSAAEKQVYPVAFTGPLPASLGGNW